MNATKRSTSADDTHRIAAALAKQCKKGDCITLRGDLGSGKTTFARGFIQALSGEREIVSPTFTLVQTYIAADQTPIAHFDLYRLKNRSEIAEIGLDEALMGGITLIEWPELVEKSLPADALDVLITIGHNPEERQFAFAGSSNWQARLARIVDEQ